jgi:hypothetical protein
VDACRGHDGAVGGISRVASHRGDFGGNFRCQGQDRKGRVCLQLTKQIDCWKLGADAAFSEENRQLEE